MIMKDADFSIAFGNATFTERADDGVDMLDLTAMWTINTSKN